MAQGIAVQGSLALVEDLCGSTEVLIGPTRPDSTIPAHSGQSGKGDSQGSPVVAKIV